MLLCIIIFSEVCTSMAVVKLMKKSQRSKTAEMNAATSDVDNHFLRAADKNHNSRHSCNKKGGAGLPSSHQAKTDTRSGAEKRSSHDAEGLNESFISYGSFNPNLDSGMPYDAVKIGHPMLLTPALESKLQSGGRQEKKNFASGSKNNYRQFLDADDYLESFDNQTRRGANSFLGATITGTKTQHTKTAIGGSHLKSTHELVKRDVFGMPIVKDRDGYGSDSSSDAETPQQLFL